MPRYVWIWLAILVFAVFCVYWYEDEIKGYPPPWQNNTAHQSPSAQIANPASVNCVDKLGGTLDIVNEVNGQVGYCHLKDGRVCEEWSLMRGGCMMPPSQ